MGHRAEQRPQIRRRAPQQLSNPRIPDRVPAAIRTFRVGQPDHHPPVLVTLQRQGRQHGLQMRDAGLHTGQRRIGGHETAHEIRPLRTDLRPDIVQYDGAQQRRACRRYPHA
jgi:IS5 family transposase